MLIYYITTDVNSLLIGNYYKTYTSGHEVFVCHYLSV